MDEQDFVNVAIRIKPVIENQKENSNYCLNVISQEPPVLVMLDRGQTFCFDNIFTEDINQETIFQKSVKPLVKHVIAGYNCTVFAYGQTGSGKTYTIGTDPRVTDPDALGLIPRTLNDFFQYNHDDKDVEAEICVSFIEIYNEKVFDLLQNNNNQPPLLVKGLKAHGFCQEKVFNFDEARHFLEVGNKNRHTAETKQNAKSSRSHAIFTIYCNVRNKNHETTAKLNLVDLAGCESVKKTGNRGSTFHEGVNINKGLLSISQVMTALSINSNFIPYRQSIITSILQDSLNKHNFISLIACINSHQEDSSETFQTLDFAQRVKKVKSKPEVNEVITQYKKDNPNIFQQNRVGNTPFKRPANFYQTPYSTKRSRPFGGTLEPFSEQSQSLQSLSLSSMSSLSNVSNNMTQQTLSPVIKKYMSAMESSLMDKMEIMIKSTLKQPNREAAIRETNYSERTPRIVWRSIENEVSKLVKTEIAQMTSRLAKTTSSPIEEIDKIRKILTYDNSLEDDKNVSLQQSANSEDKIPSFEFKIPNLPTVRKNHKRKRTLSVSPIENEPINIRRSLRLSIKNTDNSNSLNDFDLTSSYLSFEQNSPGRIHKDETRKSNQVVLKNLNSTMKRRSSIRLAKKRTSNTLTIADTPAGKKLKKSSKESPCTSHTKYVLEMLNNGNLKQLEKLHTVGPKTAQQIVLFREIKGHLQKVSDISQMPGWSGKKFDKFVDQNFLKKDI